MIDKRSIHSSLNIQVGRATPCLSAIFGFQYSCGEARCSVLGLINELGRVALNLRLLGVKSATELAEALLRIAPLPMALLDSTLRIRAANRPFLDLLKIPGDETRGRLLTDVVKTGAGFQRVLEPPNRVDASAAARPVQLYARGTSTSVTFDARWFSAYDGTSGGLLLLTRNDTPAVAST